MNDKSQMARSTGSIQQMQTIAGYRTLERDTHLGGDAADVVS